MERSFTNVSRVACLGRCSASASLSRSTFAQIVDLSACTAGGSAPVLSFDVAWLRTVLIGSAFAFLNCLCFICHWCLSCPDYFLLYYVNCQKTEIKKHFGHLSCQLINFIQILSPGNYSFIHLEVTHFYRYETVKKFEINGILKSTITLLNFMPRRAWDNQISPTFAKSIIEILDDKSACLTSETNKVSFELKFKLRV